MKPKDRKAILADPKKHHPASVIRAQKHQSELQYRIADAITTFVGSMYFIYLHVFVIALWLFFEPHPWTTLSTVLSVEAILLVSFLMIGQNRASRFAQVKADHDFDLQNKEIHANSELLKRIEEQLNTLLSEKNSRSSSFPASPPGIEQSANRRRF